MSFDNEAAIQKVAQRIESLLKRISVPLEAIKKLDNDDDWSFIIKLHSLIEASITHLLVAHFNDQRLSDFFSALDMGDTRKSRMSLIKNLDLLAPNTQCFIRRIGKVRNKLAHGIESLNFDLKIYIESLSLDDWNGLVGNMQSLLPKVEMRELIKDNARQAFFACTCIILCKIEDKTLSLRRTLNPSSADHDVTRCSAIPESKAKE